MLSVLVSFNEQNQTQQYHFKFNYVKEAFESKLFCKV